MTKKKADKPEPGKIYSLTGAPGVACIANGNTWAESEYKEKPKRNQNENSHTYLFEDQENHPYMATKLFRSCMADHLDFLCPHDPGTTTIDTCLCIQQEI